MPAAAAPIRARANVALGRDFVVRPLRLGKQRLCVGHLGLRSNQLLLIGAGFHQRIGALRGNHGCLRGGNVVGMGALGQDSEVGGGGIHASLRGSQLFGAVAVDKALEHGPRLIHSGLRLRHIDDFGVALKARNDIAFFQLLPLDHRQFDNLAGGIHAQCGVALGEHHTFGHNQRGGRHGACARGLNLAHRRRWARAEIGQLPALRKHIDGNARSGNAKHHKQNGQRSLHACKPPCPTLCKLQHALFIRQHLAHGKAGGLARRDETRQRRHACHHQQPEGRSAQRVAPGER